MPRLLAAVILIATACGGGSTGGQLGDPCTDGTCDSGLVCLNQVCVSELCSEGAADDCCPEGATSLTDSDCAPVCGNGVFEAGELCDTAIAGGTGACPTACTSIAGCTASVLVDADTCLATCKDTPITQATDNDTCCPAGANANTDNDCSPVCGNGATEGDEECDDNNTADNDGCSALCVDAPLTLDVAVVQPTIDTELFTTHQIDVTLTATNGFMGNVTLAAAVLDANQQPIPGWTAVLDATALDVPQNGTASTFVTLTIPSRNTGLAGSVVVTATSDASAGTFTATTVVTVANRITFPLTVANNQCVYPAAGTVEVTVGTTIRWANDAASEQAIVIHTDSNAAGIEHQNPSVPTPQGAFHEDVVTGVTLAPFGWYCHSPGVQVNDLLIETFAP